VALQIRPYRKGHGSALSLSWISKTLNNRAVLGEYCEAAPAYYPQIISPSEFDAVRAQAESKRKNGNCGASRPTRDAPGNLFTGLLFDITGDRPLYFQKAQRGTYLRNEEHSLRYDRFESLVLWFLSFRRSSA
jgi:hypothetical protein